MWSINYIIEVLAAPELKGVKMAKKRPLNRVLPPFFAYFLAPHAELWSLTLLETATSGLFVDESWE